MIKVMFNRGAPAEYETVDAFIDGIYENLDAKCAAVTFSEAEMLASIGPLNTRMERHVRARITAAPRTVGVIEVWTQSVFALADGTWKALLMRQPVQPQQMAPGRRG